MRDLLRNAKVLDVETTINAPAPFFGATPHHPDNRLVAIGWLDNLFSVPPDEPCCTLATDKVITISARYPDFDETGCGKPTSTWKEFLLAKPCLIIGHNLKFDLAYLFKELALNEKEYWTALSNLNIWDTMLADYYLSNQRNKMLSLEAVCELYDIPFTKDETVTESFKQGIGADRINPDILLRYLEEDLYSTYKVFLKQLELVTEHPHIVTDYLITLMNSSLTTMEMERQGLKADVTSLRAEMKTLEAHCETVKANAEKQLAERLTDLPANVDSPQQILKYFTGGTLKRAVKKEVVDSDGNVVRYKTGARKGQIKTRQQTEGFTIEPLNKLPFTPTNANEETLRKLYNKLKKDESTEAESIRLFIANLLEYRRLKKETVTYFKGYLQNVYEHDSSIHTNYNHALTKTKRLSSNNPNLQNTSNKDSHDG